MWRFAEVRSPTCLLRRLRRLRRLHRWLCLSQGRLLGLLRYRVVVEHLVHLRRGAGGDGGCRCGGLCGGVALIRRGEASKQQRNERSACWHGACVTDSVRCLCGLWTLCFLPLLYP